MMEDKNVPAATLLGDSRLPYPSSVVVLLLSEAPYDLLNNTNEFLAFKATLFNKGALSASGCLPECFDTLDRADVPSFWAGVHGHCGEEKSHIAAVRVGWVDEGDASGGVGECTEWREKVCEVREPLHIILARIRSPIYALATVKGGVVTGQAGREAGVEARGRLQKSTQSVH